MNLERFDIVRNPGKDAYADLCHEVNKYENWICGKEDYECWEKSFKDNFEFLIVYEKGTKNVVASAMLITVQCNGKNTPEFSGFGFFFVTPKHRGTGVGKTLSEKLLKSNKFVSTNGFLIAAPEMSEKYAIRHGFDKIPEWHHQIYAIKTTDITELTINDNISDTIEIRFPLEEDWEKIFEYNATIASGVRFDIFLKNWLTAEGTNTVVAVDKNTGNIAGLGHVREAHVNCLQISPLLANNMGIAEVILNKLMFGTNDIGNFDSVIFSFPSNNPDAMNLVREISSGNAVNCCHGVIQFTKKVLQVDTGRIFSGIDYILIVI